MERQPIQYAAGSLAASAFIATTQILTGAKLDLALYVALVAFTINIPFQILIFYMRAPINIGEAQHLEATSQPLSWSLRLWAAITLVSLPAILIGFVALFWHFAWWLGVLFALAAFAAFQVFHYCAHEDFKRPVRNAEKLADA
jgi:predicted outer membrane lipoprotein